MQRKFISSKNGLLDSSVTVFPSTFARLDALLELNRTLITTIPDDPPGLQHTA